MSIKLEYFIPGSCLAVKNIDHSLFICNSSALVNVYEFQWISIPLEGANVVKDQTYTYCRQLLPKRKLILIINLSLYLTTSLSRNIRWEKIPKIKMLGLVPRLLVYNNSNVGRRSGGDPNFVNNIMNLIRDLEIDGGQDLNNNQAWKHWVYG